MYDSFLICTKLDHLWKLIFTETNLKKFLSKIVQEGDHELDMFGNVTAGLLSSFSQIWLKDELFLRRLVKFDAEKHKLEFEIVEA